MRTELDQKRLETGKRNAESDWNHVQNIARYKSDNRDGYDYLEALSDAMVARMGWIMKTGFEDSYRLGYITELSRQYAREMKERLA